MPLHWHQFFDDAQAEISQVKSEIYDGGVSKGLKNGVGKVILPSGEAYKGNWKNDLRHGTGVCRFPNGSIFKGEWREGVPQGQGILYSPPNEIIEGRFEGWKLADGIVKLLFSNGELYEGNMREGLRELNGVMHYTNGDIFEGEWAKDKRIGKRGKLTTGGGLAKLTGQFVKDQVDGQVEYEDSTGNLFKTEQAESGNNTTGVNSVDKSMNSNSRS